MSVDSFCRRTSSNARLKNRAQASREIDPLSLLAFGVLLEDIQKHSIYKRLLANTGNAFYQAFDLDFK